MNTVEIEGAAHRNILNFPVGIEHERFPSDHLNSASTTHLTNTLGYLKFSFYGRNITVLCTFTFFSYTFLQISGGSAALQQNQNDERNKAAGNNNCCGNLQCSASIALIFTNISTNIRWLCRFAKEPKCREQQSC